MENNLKSSERKRGRNNLFSESKNIKMSLSTPQSPKT